MTSRLWKMIHFGYSADRILAIALISPFLMQVVQYLLLSLLGNFDSYGVPIDGMTSTLLSWFAKGTTGIVFLWAFLAIWRDVIKRLVVVSIWVLIAFFSTYALFPMNRAILLELAFPIFLVSIPIVVFASQIKDLEVFRRTTALPIFIIALIGLVIALLSMLGYVSFGTYSMSLSYYLLLPVLFAVTDFLRRPRVFPIVLALVTTAIIVVTGARGPLLSIAVLIFMLLASKLIEATITTRRIWAIVMLAVSTFGVLFWKEFFQLLDSTLEVIGLESRTVELLAKGGINLTGREPLYTKAIEAIGSSPLIGYGIGGDYMVLDGTYVHNFVLEILVHFGVFIGGAILVLLAYLMIRGFLNASSLEFGILAMWFCLGVVPLLVSGSYITSIAFWVYLGLLLSRLESKRTPRVHESGVDIESGNNV